LIFPTLPKKRYSWHSMPQRGISYIYYLLKTICNDICVSWIMWCPAGQWLISIIELLQAVILYREQYSTGTRIIRVRGSGKSGFLDIPNHDIPYISSFTTNDFEKVNTWFGKNDAYSGYGVRSPNNIFFSFSYVK